MFKLKPIPVTRKEVNNGLSPEKLKDFLPSEAEIKTIKAKTSNFELEKKVLYNIRISGRFLIHGGENSGIDKGLAMDHIVAILNTEMSFDKMESTCCALINMWYKQSIITKVANKI